MQNQIENDAGENDKQVDTPYIGNEDIKAAVEKLKVELSQARLNTNQKVNDGKGVEETIEANQIETSGNKDESIILEH